MRKVERLLWFFDIVGLLLTLGTLSIDVYQVQGDLDDRWIYLQIVGVVDVLITAIQYIHHRWHLRFIRADRFIRETNDLLQRTTMIYPMWYTPQFNDGFESFNRQASQDLYDVLGCVQTAYESNFVTQLKVLAQMSNSLDRAIYVTKD